MEKNEVRKRIEAHAQRMEKWLKERGGQVENMKEE
jgi:hypothetical protein